MRWFVIEPGSSLGSVQLDGITAYVNWPAATPWNYQFNQAFTIAIRLYINSNTTGYIYSRFNTISIRGIAIAASAGSGGLNPGFQLLDGGGNQIRSDVTDNSFLANTWTSLFFVNDGAGTVTIYQGTVTPAQNQSTTGTVVDIQNSEPAKLGINSGLLFPFPGFMRNFGVYSKAATLTERTNWNTAAPTGDPTNAIANCVSFISFNHDEHDSVDGQNGTLTGGATISSFSG